MTAMTALLAFAAWTLLLVFVSVNWRVPEVLRGVPANSWTRGQERERPGLVRRSATFYTVQILLFFTMLWSLAA